MSRNYNIIDADGHVLEPPDLWDRYIDPAFRDRTPQIVVGGDDRERLCIEGKVLGTGGGLGVTGAIGARQGNGPNWRYLTGRRGGFDPHARIKDMEIDGIDAVFLYPSLGLFLGAVEDPPLAAALYRAYNRWLATEYCAPYPDRLFGAAMLPMQSVDLAIAEMEYARAHLGMRSGFIRPNPYNGKTLDHPDYTRFWDAAQDLDFAVGLHEGVSSGMPTVGVDHFTGKAARHIVSHTMEMMLACLSVIWGGVCERHPRIRIGFLEAGGGWIAGWLDRMDRHFDDKGFNDSGLTMRPSDLFRRNCWISFEPVEQALGVLAGYIGPSRILWATDYPHSDGFFPGAPATIAACPGLDAKARRQVLAAGAIGFYGLE